MVSLKKLLELVIEKNASDLHLKVGNSPYLRVATELISTKFPPLSPEETEKIAFKIMNEEQQQSFKTQGEVDLSHTLKANNHSKAVRFRVSIFKQRGFVSLEFRHIFPRPPQFEELNLPKIAQKLAEERRGLILVTGPASSGKTTTLSALVNHINQTRAAHIVTLEDPIEILHPDQKSLVNQREIGFDTLSFAQALRHTVRQDADAILIGEMRDLEAIQAALSAAETGSLVLSTFHTMDVIETINRVIDFFPPHHQRLARILLASTLKGIVSQRLLPRQRQRGLIPATEVMVMTATIRDYILNPEETSKIKEAMEKGEYYGMHTFDQDLLRLYQEGQVSLEEAEAASTNVHDFRIKVKQAGLSGKVEGTREEE